MRLNHAASGNGAMAFQLRARRLWRAAAANPAIALWLQFTRPAGRVAEAWVRWHGLSLPSFGRLV